MVLPEVEDLMPEAIEAVEKTFESIRGENVCDDKDEISKVIVNTVETYIQNATPEESEEYGEHVFPQRNGFSHNAVHKNVGQ